MAIACSPVFLAHARPFSFVDELPHDVELLLDVVHVFVPYEDFIEKRVKVWLDGYQTNYSRDGYFSDPLCENFKYWNFNFQPEVEKFQLI